MKNEVFCDSKMDQVFLRELFSTNDTEVRGITIISITYPYRILRSFIYMPRRRGPEVGRGKPGQT